MGIIYFDICSIPLFLIILFVCYFRKMMQSIGKQIVAEGAETGDEVYLLKNMNCDYIQGFYFSRPLPADEFVRFMEQQNKCNYS